MSLVKEWKKFIKHSKLISVNILHYKNFVRFCLVGYKRKKPKTTNVFCHFLLFLLFITHLLIFSSKTIRNYSLYLLNRHFYFLLYCLIFIIIHVKGIWLKKSGKVETFVFFYRLMVNQFLNWGKSIWSISWKSWKSAKLCEY